MKPPLEHPRRRAFLYALAIVGFANACLVFIGFFLFTHLSRGDDFGSGVAFVGTLYIYTAYGMPIANGLLALFCISLRKLIARRIGSPAAGRLFALYTVLLCAAAIALNWWMIPSIQNT